MQQKIKIISHQILGFNQLPILLDIHYSPSQKPKPFVLFCHGFKGFKDWGAWHLVAQFFAQHDFIFVKFNFSHNGTSPIKPTDFVNEKGFSNNNYSIEAFDTQKVLDAIRNLEIPIPHTEIDLKMGHIIGHSRGGGAAIIVGVENEYIQKIVTWAGIDTFNRFGTPSQLSHWKENGVHWFKNARTGQNLPILYHFFEDYIKNQDRLDIKKALGQTTKPILIVHGTKDEAIPLAAAKRMYKWTKNGKLLLIENANHVFGAHHPYYEAFLPQDLATICTETVQFLKMTKPKIIVLCTGNSCRSQMAHGILLARFGAEAYIYSAGVEAHGVNPKSILVMNEIGIDISGNTSNTMQEYRDLSFDYVFTLGEKAKANCPDYNGNPKKIHQKFTDPFDAEGTEEEVMHVYRKVRDEIVSYFNAFHFFDDNK